MPGLVGSLTVGRASGDDVLTDISIPLGDTDAIQYDFAEAQPASVSGYVYRDDNNNGRRDSGEQGLANVTVRLVPKNTLKPTSPIEVKTNADGSYQFVDLTPGTYDIIEVTQPAGLQDGRDSAGTINGVTVGTADEPGDALRQVRLDGGNNGIEYNFGELQPGSLSGYVYLAAPGQVCGSKDDGVSTPLPGVWSNCLARMARWWHVRRPVLMALTSFPICWSVFTQSSKPRLLVCWMVIRGLARSMVWSR